MHASFLLISFCAFPHLDASLPILPKLSTPRPCCSLQSLYYSLSLTEWDFCTKKLQREAKSAGFPTQKSAHVNCEFLVRCASASQRLVSTLVCFAASSKQTHPRCPLSPCPQVRQAVQKQSSKSLREFPVPLAASPPLDHALLHTRLVSSPWR